MRNLESRFPVQVSKFNLINTYNKLRECISALNLLSNYMIYDAKRIIVMVPALLSTKNLN